jgi:hypothetical protein
MAAIYTDKHSLTCKPMDPCASNFLDCCWNDSLHVCPTSVYGPSAFSIHGPDITINAQLYHGTMSDLISITLIIMIRLLPRSSSAVWVLGSLDMMENLGWCLVDMGMKLKQNLGTQGDRVCMDTD